MSIQITITGDRGVGKTTTAIELARFLKGRGVPVRFKSRNVVSERRLDRESDLAPDLETMDRNVPITIVDES